MACMHQQSLIQDAFVVLLEHLGPEKTLQLWHLFFPPQEEYVKTRRKLSAGMDAAAMDQEIRQVSALRADFARPSYAWRSSNLALKAILSARVVSWAVPHPRSLQR